MIDTLKKLEVHLTIFKKRLLKEGCDKFQLYPMFCKYYSQNTEKYQLSKWDVLNTACKILVEED